MRRSSGAGPAEDRGIGARSGRRPLVVLTRAKNALRIAHADQAALGLGLHPGLTLADARARVADVATVDEDPAADQAALERIADWCIRYTPLVGLDGTDGVMLDITGCAHLFGGEAVLRDDVARRLQAMGFTSFSAIAGTPDAARALARFARGGILAPGREATALRPLPVAALGIAPDLVLALSRAGLKTIADLEDRPRNPLVARFGKDVAERLARVLGEMDHPISPRRPVPAFMAERRFAEPVVRAEDISATLNGLAEELGALLERDGAGGRGFEASFFRADGDVRHIAVSAGRPLRDAGAITRLFAERLASLADPIDAGFGFDVIRLAACATEQADAAQIGFDGRTREDEAVAALIDRLSARFGESHVLRFVPQDSHIPERRVRLLPAIAPAEAALAGAALAERSGAREPQLPLRLFDPPEPVETMAEVPDGPPKQFRWRRILHEVVAAEGPARIAPEWWRREGDTDEEGKSLTRDYFRIEDQEGHRFWLYREGLYERETGRPRWYLHGIFA